MTSDLVSGAEKAAADGMASAVHWVWPESEPLLSRATITRQGRAVQPPPRAEITGCAAHPPSDQQPETTAAPTASRESRGQA